MADLQNAETAAERIRVRLLQHPCRCLRGLRAHILSELLRRWQELARVGRLTIRFARHPSRVCAQFTRRFTDLAEELATDTAWLAGRATPPAANRRAG